MQKPNIVLILVDDLGWTDLGCYAEDDFHETPHIDGLATQGLRFTNGYATCAVCSPTRASIMSGQYPARLQITDWIPGHSTGTDAHITPKYRYELPLETDTLAERLKEAGYDTYHVGKWHLGESEQYWPLNQGFDVNVGGHSKGAPGSYHFPYAKLDKATEWTTLNLPEGGTNGDYLTDTLTDSALSLIERSSEKETSFFLNMCYYTVHTPLEGKPELIEKYGTKFEDGSYSRKNIDYASMVQSLDENVGKILSKLDELGISNNTLVVLTSDNGALAGGRYNGSLPLREGKGTHYEGGIRVPYIFRWPGKIPAKSESAEVIISSDLYPTILEAAGVHADAGTTADSLSLRPLLNDPDLSLDREAVYWHYPHYHAGKPVSVVRSGYYKLMEFLEEGDCELYDLESDIGEKVNLAAREPEKAAELLEMLHQWKKDTGASPLMDRTPETEKYARQGSGWAGSNNLKNPPVLKMADKHLAELYTFNEAEIYYTLDGSCPGRDSAVYTSSLDLKAGALIRARSYSPDGQVSDIEEFVIKAPTENWSINVSTPSPPGFINLAIDQQPGTFWEAGFTAGDPINFIIDMGESNELRGFLYQPARREFYGTVERNALEDTTYGAIQDYQLLASPGGATWEPVVEGSFNYRKYAFLDPKRINFTDPVTCRYLKFVALSSINESDKVNVEDFSVF